MNFSKHSIKCISRFHKLSLHFNLPKRFASSVPGSNVQIKISEGEIVDEKSEMLQPISLENLPRAQQRFAKEFEAINHLRIIEIFKKNKKNIIGLCILMGSVIGIYSYTLIAVKQETFLEEIDQEMEEEQGRIP